MTYLERENAGGVRTSDRGGSLNINICLRVKRESSGSRDRNAHRCLNGDVACIGSGTRGQYRDVGGGELGCDIRIVYSRGSRRHPLVRITCVKSTTGAFRSTSYPVYDVDVKRVKQPGTDPTLRRSGIYPQSCNVQELLSGSLDKSTVSPIRAASSGNRAICLRRNIRPQNDGATIAIARRVRIDRRAGGYESRSRVGFGAIALIIAADQHCATTGIAGRIDMPVEEADVLAGDLDCTALKSPLTPTLSLQGRGTMSGGVNGAGHAHDPFRTAGEHDHAVALRHALGPDHALVVHHRLDHVRRRVGGQGDHAAVSLEGAGVGDVGGEALAVGAGDAAGDGVRDHELDQPVAAHI